jgi:hypothetical protein
VAAARWHHPTSSVRFVAETFVITLIVILAFWGLWALHWWIGQRW